MSSSYLLICSLGGTPDPIVASMISWRPARVLFLASAQTATDVETTVLPLARKAGLDVHSGSSDVHVVSDAQDLKLCIETWRPLSEEVMRWLGRGDDYAVVVDFTGGTKCMTAALALLAHRWRCQFSYVGGTERTKHGVGIVLSGREQIRHTANPWNALGYATVEDAALLFDRGLHAAAANHLADAMRNITEPATKRELATLKTLADAYAAWDRFEHKGAAIHLENVRKNANDLRAILGLRLQQFLMEHIERSRMELDALNDDGTRRDRIVADLLANAERRSAEGRYDDAVARIYRAVEAISQNRLTTAYDIESDRVPLTLLQDNLQDKVTHAEDDGTVKLGLQDCYRLLLQREDDLGKRFAELGWHNHLRSPLGARNLSILAHGFEPVGEKVFKTLFEGAKQLAQLKDEDLPRFPRLICE